MIQNKYRKQIEKYNWKSEHETKYVFRERGITVIVTESALRSRANSSFRALAHFLERGARLDRQVSYALPGKHA